MRCREANKFWLSDLAEKHQVELSRSLLIHCTAHCCSYNPVFRSNWQRVTWPEGKIKWVCLFVSCYGLLPLKRKQQHEFQTLKSGKPFEVSVMVQFHCLLIKICFRCPPPPLSSPLIDAVNQGCLNWKDCRLKKSLDVFEFSKFVPWLWNLCS